MPAIAEQFEFGPFRADTVNSQLLRNGTVLKLRPQAFQVLRTLAQNSGQWISCERLIAEAWDSHHVSRHTVSVTVAELKNALEEHGDWITCRPKIGYRLEAPRSDELIKTGWHFWNRRTREGFDKALECFQQAARENDSDARAYEGIAISWLMPGTYGMRAPREIYPGYLKAFHRAVELGGLTTELRAMHAHAMHMFERKPAEAEAALLQSLQEKPNSANTYIRLAIVYATMNRLDDALDVVNQAHKADALWPLWPATEVIIRFCRREFDEAARCVKQALELQPYLLLGRAFCAQALEYAGKTEEALAQYRFARVVYSNVPWLAALEATCLARNGRQREARKILEELQLTRKAEYIDAYYMTLLMEALGRREDAFRELERAVDENSAALYILDVDPQMDSLRGDPRFTKLRNRLHRS
ncbi:MAG TPA: winged helix-turn-helix domain-containing protein [Bryobacteraceae bacterium]|nr:winged helix-turn-helix domain-containing protein [Bryobacteraceae bacterium]